MSLPRPRSKGQAAAWALALLLSGVACGGEEREIAVETIELAPGEYYGLAWGGTQVERFHVLAHRGTRDGEVVIVSPGQKTPCSLGPLSGYSTVQPINGGRYVLGSPSPARIPVFDQPDAEGRARLSFADVDCQRSELEIQGVSSSDLWRSYARDLMRIGLLLRNPDRSLDFIDPWAERVERVASDVQAVRPYDGGVWLIEAGQLVQRDFEGRVLARHGSSVREFLPLGSDGSVAYVDADGVWLRQAGARQQLAEDGCRLRSLGSFSVNAIGFFSPCATRALTIHRRDGMVFQHEHAVQSLLVQSGRLLFTVDEDESTVLYAIAASSPGTARRIGEAERFSLENAFATTRGSLLVVRPEGESDSALWLLRSAGDGYELSTLATGITALRSTLRAIAFVDRAGTLRLLRRDDLHELFAAEGVRSSGFRFAFGGSATALAVLSDVDAQSGLGTLELRFVSGAHFTLAEQVREFREVWWPEAGILYAQSGEDPGMRFARVDVPCEMVSSSPWACGF